MFYLGGTHFASEILKEQSINVKNTNKAEVQKKMYEITRNLKDELQKSNIDAMGYMLHENWMLKKSLVSGISNPSIDEVYERATKAGAMDGKLLGAIGASFMIFTFRMNTNSRFEVRLKTSERWGLKWTILGLRSFMWTKKIYNQTIVTNFKFGKKSEAVIQ